MIKVLHIVGARPQFIKLYPLHLEMKERGFEQKILHTGQHFDKNMSDVFFNEMGIPKPDYNLNINQMSHGQMTAKMMEKIEPILMDEKPDGVSFIPLIHGTSMPEQIAYSETGNPLDKNEPPKEPNTKSVRTSKWKLISNQYDGSRELYDLELDPNEEKNLFGKGEKMESILQEKLH